MDQFEPRQVSPQPFVELLKSDDERILKVLYVNNYHNFEQYVLKNSGTPDEAKDTYQEAFIAVWRNVQLARFLPNNEKDFNAYLFRVGKNKWIDELRKNKYRNTISVDDGHGIDVPAEDVVDETDTYINAVKKQYKYLGARCRELLGRFYFRKQSLREIATEFAWTDASAKNNKYRCLKQLRDLVIKKGEANG